MRIIEQSIISKYPDQKLCEDGLFISDDFIAVADGVTTKGHLSWPTDGDSQTALSMTSGCYAKEVILSALQTMPGHIDAPSAIDYLNHSLTLASLSRIHILEEQPTERLQAVVVIFSRIRREVWSFGDCQCIIDNQLYSESKKLDGLLSQIRSLYNETELLLGRTVEDLSAEDSGRRYILPLLGRQLLFANKGGEYGYDVLDGFSICPDHVVIHPVKTGSEIILASDGYPELHPTLAESEAALTKIVDTDPLCIHDYKSTKGVVKGNVSFDDRTYIRFIAD